MIFHIGAVLRKNLKNHSIICMAKNDDNNNIRKVMDSCIFQMRPEESKFVEKLNLSSTEGPKKIKGCVRLWQTDGVHTRLFFSPNGSAVAASGAHNSVQV